jgi:hypothetical protein
MRFRKYSPRIDARKSIRHENIPRATQAPIIPHLPQNPPPPLKNPRSVEVPTDADQVDISADTLPRKFRKYSCPDRGGWVWFLPCVRKAVPPAPHLASGFDALSRMALRGCSFSGDGCVSCWWSVARCRRGFATLPPPTQMLGAADRCAPASPLSSPR